MPKYRMTTMHKGIFSEFKFNTQEFDAADDEAALKVYSDTARSFMDDSDMMGFDQVKSLERVDVVEQTTKLR